MKEKAIKRGLPFFMICLFLSGVRAMPVDRKPEGLFQTFPGNTSRHYWQIHVLDAFAEEKTKPPFLLYGYEWLAFAHFVPALIFTGLYQHPARNIRVLKLDLSAGGLILPFTLITPAFRGIPFGWQLIACSFSVTCLAVLRAFYRAVKNVPSFHH